jgi:hypothetical protein
MVGAMRRALLLTFFGFAISCSRGPAGPGAPLPSSATSAAADDGLPSAVSTQPIADDAPAIVVEHDQVLVDGAAVGDLAALREAARVQRVDGEFAALKLKRETWKTAHPGAAFPGVALLRMPRDTRALVVKSVFQTAAYAGYPNLAFAVGTGSPRRIERILVDAQIPGPPGTGAGPSAATDEKVLYVHLAPDSSVMLTWKQGATVVSETEVPWRDAFERTGEDVRPAGLAAKVSAEWSAQRQHVDPQDRKLDQAIVQADDATELRFLVAALDALYETKRTLAGASVPAFNAALSLLGVAPASPGSSAPVAKGVSKMVMGATSVSGRLPPEVIQRIVRQSFGRFRGCYEAGLAKDPGLKGKVSVRFVIGKDGAVASVADAGSDLPAAGVKKCLLAAFSKLSFPAPEGGIVTAVYPLDFSPQ